MGYTEKLWGLPTKELHADWAVQRIRGLNLVSVVKDVLKRKLNFPGGQHAKSLVSSFYYPKFGTGTIYERIQRELEEKGNPIFLQSYPVKFQHRNKRITGGIFSISAGGGATSTTNLTI